MESGDHVKHFVVEFDKENSHNKKSKKIFIPVIGSLGDVKPLLILAEELQKRGHTVWLGVHKHYQDIVQATGEYCISEMQ